MSRADPPFSEPVLETAGLLRIEPSAFERQIGMDGAGPACVKDLNHYSAADFDFGDDRWLARDSFENRLLIRPGRNPSRASKLANPWRTIFITPLNAVSHPEIPIWVFEQLENVN
jgi:hypothetical protein